MRKTNLVSLCLVFEAYASKFPRYELHTLTISLAAPPPSHRAQSLRQSETHFLIIRATVSEHKVTISPSISKTWPNPCLTPAIYCQFFTQHQQHMADFLLNISNLLAISCSTSATHGEFRLTSSRFVAKTISSCVHTC